jgi:hypothetical protein
MYRWHAGPLEGTWYDTYVANWAYGMHMLVLIGDAERWSQGNRHEAQPHALGLRQYHDHQHLRRSFCRKG